MKKALAVILSVLMVASLITTCMLSTTFAKYSTTGHGSDSARVAKWGVIIKTDISSLFLDKYDAKTQDDVISFDGIDVVAPGTEGAVELVSKVSGTPEVAVEITNKAEVDLSNWEVNGVYYCPLIFTVNGATAPGSLFASAEEFETWIESRVVSAAKQYPPLTDLSTAEETYVSISWVWPFEADDDNDASNGIFYDYNDTVLGNTSADNDVTNDPTIELSITQTITQIDSFEEGLPGADNVVHNCHDTVGDHYCDECNAELSIHRYVHGECTTCGDRLYVRNYDKMTFGSYPQSRVADGNLIAILNARVGNPTTNSDAWTSYGYYANNAQSDYMWYVDVEESGTKYRGVYMGAYRPEITSSAPIADNSYQDNHTYYTGNVYWFRYDPISWRIIQEDVASETVFLMSELVLDSHEFYVNLDDRGSINPNNYEYSTIRSWLNDAFYEAAFSDLQRELILTTRVDNTDNTDDYAIDWACADTYDKVFLISLEEIKQVLGIVNPHQGNNGLQKVPTEYAKSQGVNMGSYGNKAQYSEWLLRTPGRSIWDDWCLPVGADGVIYRGQNVNLNSYGVVPAVKIKL